MERSLCDSSREAGLPDDAIFRNRYEKPDPEQSPRLDRNRFPVLTRTTRSVAQCRQRGRVQGRRGPWHSLTWLSVLRGIDGLDAVNQHRGVDRPEMHECGSSVRFYRWLRRPRPSFFATDIDARIAGRAAGLISNWSFGNTNRTRGSAVRQMWLEGWRVEYEM